MSRSASLAGIAPAMAMKASPPRALSEHRTLRVLTLSALVAALVAALAAMAIMDPTVQDVALRASFAFAPGMGSAVQDGSGGLAAMVVAIAVASAVGAASAFVAPIGR